MTRVPGSYIQGQVNLLATAKEAELKEATDGLLVEKLKAGWSCAEMYDKERRPRGIFPVMTASPIFYEGMAAMRVLAERHGDDYALGLLGYRAPQTFREKVRCFFGGKLPKVEGS